MHITSVKSYSVGQERNFFFVVVETDSGMRGVGEGGSVTFEPAAAGRRGVADFAAIREAAGSAAEILVDVPGAFTNW